MTIPVACATILEYESTFLDALMEAVLLECGFAPAAGDRVLVKPNLVSRTNARLSCTHPRVVRAACRFLLERGARVTVADSPAFGSARSVARAAGYDEALRPLGLAVRGLGEPVRRMTSFGAAVGVSRTALEADAILNLPKLKAHCQMRLTGAVKNLFGCMSGLRKALAHARFGERANRFEAMLLDLAELLPPGASVLDGVRAMHRDGPVGGAPFELRFMGASTSPVGLDTALYCLLGQSPDDVPLWCEARQRGLPGSRLEELAFPMEPLENFDAHGFRVPEALKEVSFAPGRLVRGRLKSLLHRLR